VPCHGRTEWNPDGFTEVICDLFHEPSGTTNPYFFCLDCDELAIAASAPTEVAR
jgi:hypothetical protein